MNNSIKQRRTRMKLWLRVRLGVLQMIHMPILNILLAPLAVFIVILWKVKDSILSMFEVPKILFPIWKYSICFIVIIFSIFAILFLLESVGNRTAEKDEMDLEEAFDKRDLRNGCPILINKKRVKNSDVIMREFYSSIPMRVWVEKQDNIADSMNIHFVEPLRYGGKNLNGRRIVMYTASGRKPAPRGILYDDEF